MQKFTIFTLILTILIIVVVSEIVVNEYLPSLERDETLSLDLPDSLDVSKGIQTNILGADFDMSYSPSIQEEITLTQNFTMIMF